MEVYLSTMTHKIFSRSVSNMFMQRKFSIHYDTEILVGGASLFPSHSSQIYTQNADWNILYPAWSHWTGFSPSIRPPC